MGKTDRFNASLVVHGLAEKNDKILLVEEKGHYWGIPTGTVDHGENIIEAMYREVLEEVGTGCSVDGIFKIVHFRHDERENRLAIHYFFKITLEGNPSRQENEHTLQAKWFSFDELDDIKMRSPWISENIETYFKAKKRNSLYPIDQLFQTDTEKMVLSSKN